MQRRTKHDGGDVLLATPMGSSEVPMASSYLKDKPAVHRRRIQRGRPASSSLVDRSIRCCASVLIVVALLSMALVLHIQRNFKARHDSNSFQQAVNASTRLEAFEESIMEEARDLGQRLDVEWESLRDKFYLDKFNHEGDDDGEAVPQEELHRANALASDEATAAMLKQPSSWVDGEKKLKKSLSKLVELQKQGKLLNATIVTRWLGDDIPHFFGEVEGMDEAAWMEEVNKRYAKMSERDDWERHHPEEAAKQKQHDYKDQFATGEGKPWLKKEYQADSNNQDQKGEILEVTRFMSPLEMAGDDAVVILEPTFGKHRQGVDAIFAMAEGYDLSIYLAVIEPLKAAGFTGDIVLSVSAIPKLKRDVEKYLRAQENVVAYTIDWTCYSGEGAVATGTNEGGHMCGMESMYGIPGDDEDGKPNAVTDPREPRPVATSRYELYWAWSLHYDPHNWIMLIDSRDVYFQLNPFSNVPRETSHDVDDGLLYFFGENAQETSIEKSSFNKRWLLSAYGRGNVKQFLDNPVVCSGSTMGEQVALESYLRAMVGEFDATKCKLKGCDQGFHNYLYYSKKLEHAFGIREVVLFEQGKGIINNLGALRSKSLKEWGIYDKNSQNAVLNWDKTISPVAHQIDRDNELRIEVNRRKKQFQKKWNEKTSPR